MKIIKTTIIKRGQLALISLTLMLAVAGYINYKYNPDREKNLGQTVYVNGKDSSTYDNVNIYADKNSQNKTNTDTNTTAQNTIPTNNQTNQNTKDTSTDNDSIAVFKYDRDNMFSELSENYRDIISNTNTSKDDVNNYQKKLSDLIEKKDLITMVENVIKAKGISDIVIIPTNNDDLNIVIKSEIDLKPEQIAQIQQIIQSQFGIKADKISISVVKK